MAQEGIINENVRQMQEMVLEAMDKYPFIDEYLIKPDVNTGVRMPLLIKYITTILYLRRRMGFLVEPEESFYDSIERNDYAQFEEIDCWRKISLSAGNIAPAVKEIATCQCAELFPEIIYH